MRRRTLFLLLAVFGSVVAAARAEAAGEVVLVPLHGIVHPIAADFIVDSLAQADRDGAAAVVIELDTPGGLMSSTRAITTAILGAKVPVVVYVGPSGAQAASAGFFILMAGDVAAMAPGTNTGAAHPVGPGGQTIEGPMAEKVEQDSSANIRALASRNKRSVELAESAVLKSRSFTADEALKNGLVDAIAPSIEDLLRQLDGRTLTKSDGATAVLRTAGAPLRSLEMRPVQRLLAVLANPDIAYILLTLGFLGIYFELAHPGAVLPGVVGGVAIVLAFFSLSFLPVDYAGVALIVLGLLFFVLEIKITSYGMLTVAGVISLLLGSSMLFKTTEPALRVSRDVALSVALFAAAVAGLLVTLALRARRLPVRTGLEGLRSETGIARSALEPRGKVFVHGELWDARADQPVAAGEAVEILDVEGTVLRVRARQPIGKQAKEMMG
jgi:membrane-bound serine protease (ClpP class)